MKFKNRQFVLLIFCTLTVLQGQAQLSIPQMLAYPFPGNLCTSSDGKLAWTINREGRRNIFITLEGGNIIKLLTNNQVDDGQEISRLTFSPNGKWLVYMKGGEPDGNWSENKPVNPASLPGGTHFEIRAIAPGKTNVILLAAAPDENAFQISPDSKRVAFIKDAQVWIAPIDGSEKAKRLFPTSGNCRDIAWSPDGSQLAFVSDRGSYSFIGIFRDSLTPIQWIAPDFARDINPVWSPDGKSLVYIRRPAVGGPPDSILKPHPRPWEIRVVTFKGGDSKRIWRSPHTLRGSVPSTQGRYNLHWAAHDRIVFLSEQDNWPHLYSIPAEGGEATLLTPGHFMVEHISLSPDGLKLIFSANTGPEKEDQDRRHIGIVSVDKADMQLVTIGKGIEAYPVFFQKDKVACISSDAIRPALPAIISLSDGNMKVLCEEMLPKYFNSQNMVVPQQVVFKAPDGTLIHGQLFKKKLGQDPKPAIVYIHGGPMRQMLLGWSYSGYYAAHYAMNQKLADMGFVVLSVNYRLGIGYGHDFHHAPHTGREGAGEYQDILAAGKWLAQQKGIDLHRIGVYGGSYGGYLTALALGKNSEVFKAGVDIHGVHNLLPRQEHIDGFVQAPDAALADTIAFQSSPISWVEHWTSPVLLIHADDDRNVNFQQSIDLLNRLKANDVPVETLVIPGDTHHWLMHKNLVRVQEAAIEFLSKHR